MQEGWIIKSGEEEEASNLKVLKYLKEMGAEQLGQGGEVIQHSKLIFDPVLKVELA